MKHNPFGLKGKPTLEELYFKPLDSILLKNNGRIYSEQKNRINLIIDIKSKNKKAISILRSLCKKYNSFYKKIHYGDKSFYPIRILITGKVPIDELDISDSKYFNVEAIYKKNYPNDLIPLIYSYSANFKKLKRQNGDEIYTKIQEIQKDMVLSQKSFRLWKVENKEQIWSELIDIGVNFISVDDLERFYTYHNHYRAAKVNKKGQLF